MSYCDKKNESDIFGKSIVCGELIFWMAEVLNCVPKTEMESLLNKIIASGTAVKNGIIVYDRKRWNKEIQILCLDKKLLNAGLTKILDKWIVLWHTLMRS